METDSSTKKESPHRYIKFTWYQVCHSALDAESMDSYWHLSLWLSAFAGMTNKIVNVELFPSPFKLYVA
jgi:hypothetical protein